MKKYLFLVVYAFLTFTAKSNEFESLLEQLDWQRSELNADHFGNVPSEIRIWEKEVSVTDYGKVLIYLVYGTSNDHLWVGDQFKRLYWHRTGIRAVAYSTGIHGRVLVRGKSFDLSKISRSKIFAEFLSLIEESLTETPFVWYTAKRVENKFNPLKGKDAEVKKIEGEVGDLVITLTDGKINIPVRVDFDHGIECNSKSDIEANLIKGLPYPDGYFKWRQFATYRPFEFNAESKLDQSLKELIE